MVSDKKKQHEAVIELPKHMVNEGAKAISGESVARVHAKEYLNKGQANLIREAMIKGYVEMSHINLSICMECLHAEYEAQHTTERLVSGG